MGLVQTEIVTINDSRGYYPGSNYAVVKKSGAATFIKLPAVDEFIRLIPFERFDGSPGASVSPAVPDADAAADKKMAHLPTNATTDETGAEWYAFTQPTSPDSNLSVEDSPTSFSFTTVISRVVAPTGFEMSAEAEQLGGRFKQLASLMAVRELSRQLVNGDGTSNTPTGLASLYDGTNTLETQLLDAVAIGGLVDGVRELVRTVSASGDHGFGETANALFMSRRAADELISSLSSSGDTVSYHPDGLNPGQLRMHFNGTPVYFAPVRDDEDSGGPGFPAGNGVARV